MDVVRCGACRLNLVPSVISNCLFSVIPAPAAVLLALWVEAEVAGLKRDDLRSRADNHEITRATASPRTQAKSLDLPRDKIARRANQSRARKTVQPSCEKYFSIA